MKHPNNEKIKDTDNLDFDLDRELEKTSDHETNENEATEVDLQVEDVATTAPISRAANLNKYFLYTLVAGLIISALISIIAVLVGEFSSTMARALSTTVSMVGHTLVALLIVSVGSRHRKGGGLILGTILTITIASFITSILAIWQIIKGDTVSDLYSVYLYTFCAVLWVQLLLRVGKNARDKATHTTSLVGVGFTGLFYVLLVPTVFIHYPNHAAEFHLRALAAAAIALATASVLAIVFHRIHLFKHPEDRQKSPGGSLWTTVIIILVVFFLGIPVALSAIAAYVSRTSYESTYGSTSSTSQTQQSIEKQRQENAAMVSTTAVDCTDLAQFQNQKVMRHVGHYSFVSTDEIDRTLTVSYQGSSQSMMPISYQSALTVVDAECNGISIDTIEPGDTIQLYLHSSYHDFYSDALALVQKVN